MRSSEKNPFKLGSLAVELAFCKQTIAPKGTRQGCLYATCVRWKISTSGIQCGRSHGVDSNYCGYAGDGSAPTSDEHATEKRMCVTGLGATPCRS